VGSRPPGGGAVCPLRGVSCLHEVLILNEIRAQHKIYILLGTFLGLNMKLVLFCNLNFTKLFVVSKVVIH
jgi:hypothetical protein